LPIEDEFIVNPQSAIRNSQSELVKL